jgi:alpha-tubulin suppressor-like RCC1 family protein
LFSNGTVMAWGNIAGFSTNVPAGLNSVAAIASGGAHCLALRSNGTVVAWGDNHSRQAIVPANLSGVIAVAAGQSHSLALKSDGTVVAWGDNSVGQTNQLQGLSNVVAIAAKGYRNHAIMVDLKITSLQRTSSDTQIRFHTFSGQQYSVQYSSNLTAGTWMNLPGSMVAGNGQVQSVTDTNAIATASLRFYRLRQP